MKKQKGKKPDITISNYRPYDKDSKKNFVGFYKKDKRKTKQKRVIDYLAECEELSEDND